MQDSGIDDRVTGASNTLSDRHPLRNAIELTPPVRISGDGFEAVLRAGYIPVHRSGFELPDVSYRVVADSMTGRSKQPLTLINVDDAGRVRDRYRRQLTPKQLKGCVAMLRLMIASVDPNAQEKAWDKYIGAISNASPFSDQLKLLTVGVGG